MPKPTTRALRRFSAVWVVVCLLIATGSLLPRFANGQVQGSSAPASAQAKTNETIAVFAGGCFWGVDGVFKHVRGVTNVTSGYSGGSAATAKYESVSTGTTGHAESVKVAYDPAQVSYSQLLKVFFLVAHDPTELNRQGPDEGRQYRSAIFYTNGDQRRMAQEYIRRLTEQRVFHDPIVTQIVPLKGFFPAEGYHQNFLERNPDNPYIVFNDLPKIAQLHKQFPELYVP